MGRYKSWIDINLLALDSISSQLSDSAIISLNKFNSLRNAGFICRILGVYNFDYKRSNKLQTVIVIIGLILGRI